MKAAPWPDLDLAVLSPSHKLACFGAAILAEAMRAMLEQICERYGVSPAHTFGLVMAALSTAAGNRITVANGHFWSTSVSFQALLVGGPGSGKDVALRLLQETLAPIENDERVAAGYSAARGGPDLPLDLHRAKLLLKSLEKKYKKEIDEAMEAGLDLPGMTPEHEAAFKAIHAAPRLMTSSAVFSDLFEALVKSSRGVALIRDDGRGLLAPMAADQELAILLARGHAGGPFQARSKNYGEARVDNAFLTVLAGIEPGFVEDLKLENNGRLISQYVFLSGPDVTDPGSDGQAQPRLAETVSSLRAMDLPNRIGLDCDAERLISAARKRWCGQATSAHKLMDGYLQRLHWNTIKIAALFVLFEIANQRNVSEPVISGDAMQSAIKFADEYAIPAARQALLPIAGSRKVGAARFLARHLKTNRIESFNARLVRQRISGPVRNAKDMAAACELLEEAGIVRQLARHDNALGPTRLDFEVNPAFHVSDWRFEHTEHSEQLGH